MSFSFNHYWSFVTYLFMCSALISLGMSVCFLLSLSLTLQKSSMLPENRYLGRSAGWEAAYSLCKLGQRGRSLNFCLLPWNGAWKSAHLSPNARSKGFFCNGPEIKYVAFSGRAISAATLQLCPHGARAAIDNLPVNEPDCVPISVICRHWNFNLIWFLCITKSPLKNVFNYLIM